MSFSSNLGGAGVCHDGGQLANHILALWLFFMWMVSKLTESSSVGGIW
jgi:hypothetical protein